MDGQNPHWISAIDLNEGNGTRKLTILVGPRAAGEINPYPILENKSAWILSVAHHPRELALREKNSPALLPTENGLTHGSRRVDYVGCRIINFRDQTVHAQLFSRQHPASRACSGPPSFALRQRVDLPRSEERRVGKECRSRWS